jgi:hypothetical protein
MYDKLVIGIDQSYTRTGISIAADGKLYKVGSEAFKGCKNKTEKRIKLARVLERILSVNTAKAHKIIILCERIRMFSGGAVSISYIKATGALIGCIVDAAYKYNVSVYSVDTRSWKAQVVGTTKAAANGDKKLPTIRYICSLGFMDSLKSVNKKGEVVYNDDAADSACIALYGFIPVSKQGLKLEE